MKINKKYSLIILVVIAVLLVICFVFLNNKKNNLIIKQIENFSLYKEITDPAERFFWEDCNANEEFNQFKEITKRGSMKKLILTGGAQTMITPNYYNWDNEKFLSFLTVQPEAFCGVGGFFPINAYKNNLLWFQRCSGGAIFEEDGPAYQEFIRCTKTEGVVSNYFQ